MIDEQTVEKILKAGGWKNSRFGNETVWLVVLDQEPETIHLTAQIKNEWFYAAVFPLIETPSPEAIPGLALHLARLNQKVSMVKFFIDEGNDVGLMLELPLTASQELAEQAIQLVAYYAGRFKTEINQLAKKEPSRRSQGVKGG